MSVAHALPAVRYLLSVRDPGPTGALGAVRVARGRCGGGAGGAPGEQTLWYAINALYWAVGYIGRGVHQASKRGTLYWARGAPGEELAAGALPAPAQEAPEAPHQERERRQRQDPLRRHPPAPPCARVSREARVSCLLSITLRRAA
jgi:hypothetical protein